MANRRCLHALSRRTWALFSTNTTPPSLQILLPVVTQPINPNASQFSRGVTTRSTHWSHPRHFSSNRESDDVSEDDDEDDDDEDDEDEEMSESDEEESVGNSSASGLKREYTAEEREAEAAAIGYKVVGPLERSDRVFKPYEAVFAVVQVRFRHFLCRFLLGGIEFHVFFFFGRLGHTSSR
jgi:large subunit ribosomal protein L21